MYARSTLSHPDAVSAVELFEHGFTAKSVAISLDLARSPVQMLYQRWQLGERTDERLAYRLRGVVARKAHEHSHAGLALDQRGNRGLLAGADDQIAFLMLFLVGDFGTVIEC